MSKLKFWLLIFIGFVGLVGCESVQTTKSGAIGVERKQKMISFISSKDLERQYASSYTETVKQAAKSQELDNESYNAKRLYKIMRRIIPQVAVFREDALKWDWQVNLIDKDVINANCGPGGKIIFYSGIIERLNLNDDEIAAVMGHEIAHALREHGRESYSKAYGAQLAGQLASLLGASEQNLKMANVGVNYLMLLPNSRKNENEADLIGLELMARAGYNPNAAINLWQKMLRLSGGQSQPEFISTHPSAPNRIASLKKNMVKVIPLYNQAKLRHQ